MDLKQSSYQKYHRTIDASLRDLIQMLMSLSQDEDITYDIISKTWKSYSVKCFQSVSKLEALNVQNTLREFQFSYKDTIFLYKKALFFFKRDYLSNFQLKRSEGFDELSWVLKSLSNFVFVFHFPKEQVMQILDITQSEYLLFCDRIERVLIGDYEQVSEESKSNEVFDLGHRELMEQARRSFKRKVGLKRNENSLELRRKIPTFAFPSSERIRLKQQIERFLVSQNMAKRS